MVVVKPKDSTSRVITTDLVDISFTGLGISAKEQIKVGKGVQSELKSQLWDEPIVVEGRVKHSQKIERPDSNLFRIGIEFTNADQKTMRYFINRVQANISLEQRERHYF